MSFFFPSDLYLTIESITGARNILPVGRWLLGQYIFYRLANLEDAQSGKARNTFFTVCLLFVKIPEEYASKNVILVLLVLNLLLAVTHPHIPKSNEKNMSQCEIVGTDLLIEFLEVAFNDILHARKIYPDEVFAMRKIYGTVTYVSQHPELNEYLENVLKTIRQWILMDRSGVSAINMKFFNADQRLIEKYVFDLMDLKDDHLVQKDPYFIETEELLRRLSLQLSMTMSYLNPLPEGSSFSIDVDARRWIHVAYRENSMSQKFAWILNPETSSSDFLHNDKAIGKSKSSLLPLVAIKNRCLRLELFVLEMTEQA